MLGGKVPPTRAPETSCSHDAPCERPFRFRDISRHVVAGRAVHAVYFQGRENDEAGDAARGCGYDAATATDAACEEQRRMRMEIARLVLGVLLLVAFALLTVQLYNGRWLFLIAKPEKTKKGTFFPEGTANTGKRAAWVMVACFAVTATLMAYEMSKMTGVPAFAQTSSILNNIALVAFCLSLLWTLFAGRDEQNYRDRFKKDGVRLLVLLLGACAVMTALSILFV